MPFTAESLNFLADLAENNNRDWFEPRKEDYKKLVRGPMLDLVTELNRGLAGFAPAFCTDPAKAVFRIYRDVRFSKDKRPYKTNVAALFWDARNGKHGGPGYYVSIWPEQIMVAGGIYAPAPPDALMVRQHIANHHERLREVLAAKALTRQFGAMESESLQRAPKGFAPDHPAVDLLKQKHWIMAWTEAGDACLKPKYAASVLSGFETLEPFVRFLSEPFAARAGKPKDPLSGPRSRPAR